MYLVAQLDSSWVGTIQDLYIYICLYMLGCVRMCVCVHVLHMFCAFFANQYVLYTYVNCYVSAMNKLNKYHTVQKFSGRKFDELSTIFSKISLQNFENITQRVPNNSSKIYSSKSALNLSKILSVKLLCCTTPCYCSSLNCTVYNLTLKLSIVFIMYEKNILIVS